MNEAEVEEFYVAARILEATAKSDASSMAEATVYAQVAESVNSGRLEEYEDVDLLLDELESGMSDEQRRFSGGEAVNVLRQAVKEIHESGRADIVNKVDDTVVARLRSEFDGSG